MKSNEIIFIASWNIEIPPNWYWAVEDIIWNYKIFLEKQWYNIKIVNTKNILKLLKETVFVKNKILHFHYEPYLIISYIFNKLFFKNNKILWTSHNGYITNWKESFFYKIISKIIWCFSDSIMVSLSSLMENYFLSKWFKGKKFILQNWIDINKFTKILEPEKEIIYLWNINKNKWQDLFLKYYNLSNKVDFIWPYLEEDINLRWNNYLWVWNKQQVYNNLWKYKVLVLLTRSEWDPLVVKEALSSWCSIITSKVWWVNLEVNNFIKIIDIDNTQELKNINMYLSELLENNEKSRKNIFEYSKKFYWSNIIKEYKKILDEI